LTVEPVEFEPGRYFVQSRSNGGIPYLVDMTEFAGNGWCGCPGFLHYIARLEEGAAPSPALQCRHIQAAQRFLKHHTT
jgi:hypothetical protein